MKISNFEKMFAKEYISNGFKAWLAYYELRPYITKLSAYTLGPRVLRRERVQQYIDDLIYKQYGL